MNREKFYYPGDGLTHNRRVPFSKDYINTYATQLQSLIVSED